MKSAAKPIAAPIAAIRAKGSFVVDEAIRSLVDSWLVPLMVDEFLKRKPPAKETLAPKRRAG
jgi:hypothetical protein